MKRFRRISLSILIIILLTSLVLAADSCGAAEETLEGKNLLLLGDSYSAHHNLTPEEGWPSLISAYFGMTLYDYAISGSSFAGGDNGQYPMVDRYDTVANVDYDIIILQGGSNDWSHEIPIGSPDSRDETTMLGAMNVILDYFGKTWPDAAIICFTPWVSTGAVNDLGLETTAYTEAMLELCEDRGILCYNASNTAQNGIYMNEESFRAKYCLSAADRWHLNSAGQKLFASAFSTWLEAALLGITTADRFSDMSGASLDLRNAVSLVYNRGIMNGTSDTLFSPTQAATRAALAVTLYRMAGTPSASAYTFSDVSPEESAYRAICWAVETGLMTTEDTAFSPDGMLHRDELVWSLYTYHRNVSGGEILRLIGLGQFSDSDSIPDGQETAWGWALSEGLISVQNKLQPDALVSRGQLAMALSGLMQVK